jgi:hypothetical protein
VGTAALTPDVAAAVEALSTQPASPLVIVFSDEAYLPILANWIEHAKDMDPANIVVVALDRATEEAMATLKIGFVRLLPVASHNQLWIRRAELFAGMAAAGIDFIHSDADAIWLRSPIAEILNLGTDLVFSTGTIWPHNVAEEWGFVLCCGLFGVRAGPSTTAFFAKVLERIRSERDDQIAVNRELLSKGIVWRYGGVGEARVCQDRSFRVFRDPVIGHCEGLDVAVLPHRRYPRLPEISEDTVVAHPLSPQTASGTIRELRRLGLWRMP